MLKDFAQILKKKIEFFQKIPFFFKGVKPCFWPKNANFFHYLNFIKTSLEIMLSDFAEKKRNFFNLTKQNFSKSKKSHIFPKGLTYAFVQKMPIFSLFKFDQNKPRNNA